MDNLAHFLAPGMWEKSYTHTVKKKVKQFLYPNAKWIQVNRDCKTKHTYNLQQISNVYLSQLCVVRVEKGFIFTLNIIIGIIFMDNNVLLFDVPFTTHTHFMLDSRHVCIAQTRLNISKELNFHPFYVIFLH